MKIIIDTDNLEKLKISPNEYVYLYIKKFNLLINIKNEVIEKRLIEKGFINKEGKVVLPFENEIETDWITEWIELWPKGVLKATGYPVSGNEKEVRKRLIRFMLEYPDFNKDIIMQATKNYLETRKQKGWAFTQKNMKFIKDRDTGSELARWCEAIDSHEPLQDNNVFL